MAKSSDYISISELAERTKIPAGSWYHRSRRDEIPGQVRIGRLVRIHWPTFSAHLQAGMATFGQSKAERMPA